MPDTTKLDHVADLVIRRVVRESARTDALAGALERAYPFADLPSGREIWAKALVRNANIISSDGPQNELNRTHGRSSGKAVKARSA